MELIITTQNIITLIEYKRTILNKFICIIIFKHATITRNDISCNATPLIGFEPQTRHAYCIGNVDLHNDRN